MERLLEANRHARPTRPSRVTFVAVSDELARGIQHLLLRFGVVTSRHAVSETHRGALRRLHALVLEPVAVRAVDVDAAARLGVPARAMAAVGRPVPRHAVVEPSSDPPDEPGRPDVCWDEVVSISRAGTQQVYDLTVPGLANFVAADVVVHNTAFALGIATHVAVEVALPVIFFSLEMGHKELTQRILAAEARVDSQKMRTGRLSEQDWSKIGKAIGRLEAPLFIDDNPNVTVMEIRAKARRLAQRYGQLGLVVVDYLQLMTGRSGAENRQVEVSEISRGLKILARELNVPIIALSQLSRNLESRADKRPMLADLRESGSIEQDADVVMFIYRDEVYNPESADRGVAEVIVAKHRNGPIGAKRLVFLGPYTRFDNAARGM
jgi:replicative DNA helicase